MKLIGTYPEIVFVGTVRTYTAGKGPYRRFNLTVNSSTRVPAFRNISRSFYPGQYFEKLRAYSFFDCFKWLGGIMSHRFKTVLNGWEGECASAWGSLRSCDLFIFYFSKRKC